MSPRKPKPLDAASEGPAAIAPHGSGARGRSRPLDATSGHPEAHLGRPFSQGVISKKPLAERYVAEGLEKLSDASPVDIDNYDVEGTKKRLIVMFLEVFQHWMRSPGVSMDEKVTKGLAAMAQWEGTRRIIEWDKRRPAEADLLKRAD